MIRFALIFALIYMLILCTLLIYDKNKIFKKILRLMTLAYIGFNPYSLNGIIKGLLWSFADGFLTGLVVYFIINLFT
jgi:hypothetical protein